MAVSRIGAFALLPNICEDGSLTLSASPHEEMYKITGPPELIRWMEKHAVARVGELSQVSPIQMTPEEKALHRVPPTAEYYGFLHPPAHSRLQGHDPSPTSAEQEMLCYGGFVFFSVADKGQKAKPSTKNKLPSGDSSVSLVGATAITRTVCHTPFGLEGPYPINDMLQSAEGTGRYHPCVYSDLSERGVEKVSWFPNEAVVHDAPLGVIACLGQTEGCYYIISVVCDPRTPLYCESTSSGFLSPCTPPMSYSISSNSLQNYKRSDDVIGQGSFGKVFLGFDRTTARQVAMKVISIKENDRSLVSRVQAEHNVMRSLDHPNLVKILSFSCTPSQAVLVMERIPGAPLSKIISFWGAGGVPLPNIVHLLRQVVEAVGYLHSKNIIHRDLKPANVMCTPEGNVKVLDFGAAHQLALGDVPFQGTVAYCSPESFDGVYSPAQDVWAIGCIALEMATGTKPWKHIRNVHPCRLFRVIMKEQHPIPTRLPEPLVEVIQACMKSNVAERFTCDRILSSSLFTAADWELHAMDERFHHRTSIITSESCTPSQRTSVASELIGVDDFEPWVRSCMKVLDDGSSSPPLNPWTRSCVKTLDEGLSSPSPSSFMNTLDDGPSSSSHSPGRLLPCPPTGLARSPVRVMRKFPEVHLSVQVA